MIYLYYLELVSFYICLYDYWKVTLSKRMCFTGRSIVPSTHTKVSMPGTTALLIFSPFRG